MAEPVFKTMCALATYRAVIAGSPASRGRWVTRPMKKQDAEVLYRFLESRLYKILYPRGAK